MSHVYCQECGFQNPEAASYCSRCGALLVKEPPAAEATQTFTPDDAESGATEALDDLAISKIRYLEDQGLLMPRRTRGGYRLFSDEDVERLETILRLQRDEFLPLRVIRQQLAAPGATERRRKRPLATETDDALDLGAL